MQMSDVGPGRALPVLFVLALAPLGAVQQPSSGVKPAPPQQSSTATTLPSARTVIDRHVKAIGGREAILGHSSTHVTGMVTIPSAGLTGTIEVFAARPDRSLVRSTVPGVGEIQEGFNGTVGWSISPLTGPTLLDGKQLEQKKFDSNYDADLQPEGRYKSMTTLEQTVFEERPCYKVSLVRPSGEQDIHYYDVETGLKAGALTTRETPMGTVTATTVDSDYRRFGRLLQPTKMVQRVMGLQQVFTITAIEYDTVDPAVFELPAQIKALVK